MNECNSMAQAISHDKQRKAQIIHTSRFTYFLQSSYGLLVSLHVHSKTSKSYLCGVRWRKKQCKIVDQLNKQKLGALRFVRLLLPRPLNDLRKSLKEDSHFNKLRVFAGYSFPIKTHELYTFLISTMRCIFNANDSKLHKANEKRSSRACLTILTACY